jgi:beta-mannosidase
MVLMPILLMTTILPAQQVIRSLNGNLWTFNKQGDSKKYIATIPGTIHTDLKRNKLIPDPFFGANENLVKWVENENWEYHTTFFITEKELNTEDITLRFDGLDTYAHVTLNGETILKADNMFCVWAVPVKDHLVKGKNELKIQFQSATNEGKNASRNIPYTLPEGERVFVRKAQCHFGWDWGPRFVTAGIWKNVSLQFNHQAYISNVRYEQEELNDQTAKLNFVATVTSFNQGTYSIQINDSTYNISLKSGINVLKLPYEINHPKRWWCHGLGTPHLYDFKVTLLKRAKPLDSESLKIGLRTIELIQKKDERGQSFYFQVNGVPVFMKGANYIPPHSFLPETSKKTYQQLIKDTRDANMNMLRVWGGGVYADDQFYEECDKNGILVWQDFMFACAMYPGDDRFLSSVKKEVIDNVNRLQNHACIALWCGNNEIDEAWHNWGWQKQYNYSLADSTRIWKDYEALFHLLIPKTLDSLLSKDKNIYWPSSPSIGWGRKESLTQGDSHYWGVWWGMQPFEMYKEKTGRFVSEYGFQGMPDISTFRKFARENELNLASVAVKHHQKHPTGYKTIDTYMERDYKIPQKFEDYIYTSQLLQADGMKTAIEAHRRAKPYCMGSLYWQLNDCWPVTSWSSVDFYGRWKAFHYQAKRSFENLLVSVNDENNQYAIYIINDNLHPSGGILKAQLLDFKGQTLWSHSKAVTVQPNSNQVAASISKGEFASFDSTYTALHIQLVNRDTVTASTIYYFAKPKNLRLAEPKVVIKYSGPKTIEVTTDILAKNVFLSSDQVFFDDNFFDLLPGQTKIVHVSKPTKHIKAKSLVNH